MSEKSYFFTQGALKIVQSPQSNVVIPTALATFAVVLCCCLLSFTASRNSSKDIDLVTTLEPTIMPVVLETNVPETVAVEYQLEVSDTDTLVNVQFWYTSGATGNNQTATQSIRSGRPHSIFTNVEPGDHLALSGVITGGREGKLTCRILVEGQIIQQSTIGGGGAGVYCSGIVNSQ